MFFRYIEGVFLFCWTPFFTVNIINAACLRYSSDLNTDSLLDDSTASPLRSSDTAAAVAAADAERRDVAASVSDALLNPDTAAVAASADVSSSSVLLTSGLCDIDPMLFSFLVWLGYINSFMNPIIYTIFNAEFRRAFKKILCRRPTPEYK